jgi:hypothetical protein
MCIASNGIQPHFLNSMVLVGCDSGEGMMGSMNTDGLANSPVVWIGFQPGLRQKGAAIARQLLCFICVAPGVFVTGFHGLFGVPLSILWRSKARFHLSQDRESPLKEQWSAEG